MSITEWDCKNGRWWGGINLTNWGLPLHFEFKRSWIFTDDDGATEKVNGWFVVTLGPLYLGHNGK